MKRQIIDTHTNYFLNYSSAYCIRVIYTHDDIQYPLLIEIRSGPQKGCVMRTSVDGKEVTAESHLLRGAFASLVAQLSPGASIKILHHLMIFRNQSITPIDVFEEICFSKKRPENNVLLEPELRLSVEIEQKVYYTQFHDDIYDAIEELLGLIDQDRQTYFQICPFCKYSYFGGTEMVCLRDSEEGVLKEIKIKGKHIQNRLYKDLFSQVDELHYCSSFDSFS